MSQNWRTEVNASDYLSQQKRQSEIDRRRPTVRKASDLVGPGIGAGAVRLDDYNNLLATFNGYYASEAGALNAPNSAEAFVGQVVSDSVLGGRQTFTGLTSGTEYSRTFTRSPTDPETVGWGLWTGQRIPAMVNGFTIDPTRVLPGIEAILKPPTLDPMGEPGVYDSAPAGILIRKQGVYTGNIQVGCNSPTGVGQILTIRMPYRATTISIGHVNVPLAATAYYPFTIAAFDGTQGFNVSVLQGDVVPINFWWRFSCTRIADAV